MIILHEKMGQQLGNRLTLFSHFIGFSERVGKSIIYPAFDEYCEFFLGTVNNPFCQYPVKFFLDNSYKFHSKYVFIVKAIYYKFKVPTIAKHIDYIRDIKLDSLADCAFVNSSLDDERVHLLSQSGINFFEGWKFRDFESVSKYSDKIKQFFSLIPAQAVVVNEFIKNARSNSKRLIGLHIRLGDYKNQAPQWFYSLSYYQSLIEHLSHIFSDHNTKIVIASNEDLRSSFLVNKNLIFCPNHIVQDLYILSQCDYIIGAPSTYSEWAAFYGSKPYFRILKEGIFPCTSDFQFVDIIGRDF
jgi:hypothetical protein